MRAPLFTLSALFGLTVSWCALSAPARADVTLPREAALREGFVLLPPQGKEALVVDDAKDGRLDRVDLLTAMVVASGVKDADVDTMVKRVRAALEPVRERARAHQDGEARGRALLRGLHESVLRKYEAGATTINGVVEAGTYNCLSSAALFVVAADGLLGAPQAMFTERHAFARVTVDGAVLDVETTSPNGFGADRRALLTPTYLRQLAFDAYQGTTDRQLLEDLKNPTALPPAAFVAGIYANRGVAAVVAGDLEGAAVAFDRAAKSAPAALSQKLSSWRASLLESAVASLLKAERLHDARTLLLLAREGTVQEQRRRIDHNLGVVALRLGNLASQQGDMAAALQHYDEAVSRGLGGADVKAARAHAQGEVLAQQGGDAKACDDGDPASTVRCLERLVQGAIAQKNLPRALSLSRQAMAVSPTEVPARRALAAAALAQAQKDFEAVRCDEAAALLALARPHLSVAGAVVDEAAVVSGCYANDAKRAFDRGDATLASARMRRALSLSPDAAHLKRNAAAVELQRAYTFTEQGSCDEARAAVAVAAGYDPSQASTGTRLLEGCINNLAISLAEKKRFAEGVAVLRVGLRDNPQSALLEKNLAALLHNHAVTLLQARKCEQARELLTELRARGRLEIVKAIDERCAAR